MRRQHVFLVCPGQKVSPAHHLTRKGSDKGRTPMNSKGKYKSPLVIISQWVTFARNFWRLLESPPSTISQHCFLKQKLRTPAKPFRDVRYRWQNHRHLNMHHLSERIAYDAKKLSFDP